jgi:uncharacterized protein (TIGR00730 family)
MNETDPENLKVRSKHRSRRLTERLSVLRERVILLEQELNTITSSFFRVCIFGSNRIQDNDELYRAVERLGFLLGENGIDVLTGGGLGLMKAANKGVLQGRNSSGSKSKSFGISIELGRLEAPNEHLDIKHHHRRFSSRLDDFMRLSNAVIVTPGGIGTLLELYFTWQLLQVGHMTARPMVLLGKEFWSGIILWMNEFQVKRGLVSPHDMDWIHVVDTPEEAITIVLKEYEQFKLSNTKQSENQSEVKE